MGKWEQVGQSNSYDIIGYFGEVNNRRIIKIDKTVSHV